MSQAAPRGGPAWSQIDLVVFDVDGTLYEARRLRALMALWLAMHTLRAGAWSLPRQLAVFRQVRERLAQAQAHDFVDAQYRVASQRAGCSADAMRSVVEEWMQRRPLPLLRACARPGVQAVFAGLRARGIQVAVLSDYPARAKLEALGLQADPVVWAGDAAVQRLKPDPRGLHHILTRTGIAPARALMVGDRLDRDGAAAARASMPAVILAPERRRRSDDAGAPVFWARGFLDPLFAPVREPLG